MITPEELTNGMVPYLTMLVGLVASLWIKDFTTSLVSGLSFKYNPQFNEGDHVLIDDDPAIIVKIGYRHTVFSVTKSNGKQIWRYVKNERIPLLKLEKIVFNPSDINS